MDRQSSRKMCSQSARSNTISRLCSARQKVSKVFARVYTSCAKCRSTFCVFNYFRCLQTNWCRGSLICVFCVQIWGITIDTFLSHCMQRDKGLVQSVRFAAMGVIDCMQAKEHKFKKHEERYRRLGGLVHQSEESSRGQNSMALGDRGDELAVQSPWRSLKVLRGQFNSEPKEVWELERLRPHRCSPLTVLLPVL